jgi:small subunit ribosomal protein S16
MIKIRLARGGRKKVPYYRIIATNCTSPRDSKFLEKLGTYNPLAAKDSETRITINKERAEYWLSVGAQPTEKVAKFLQDLGCKGAEKYQPNFKPKEKGEGLKKKALEKLKAQKEAEEEAKAAEAEAKAAEKEAAEAAKAAAAEAKAAEKPAPQEAKPEEAKAE